MAVTLGKYIPLFLAGASVALAVHAQTAPQKVADYPSQTAYPHEDRAAVSRHLARAYAIAGNDLWSEFRWRCLISPLDSATVWGVQHNGIVPPTRLFDNLYSIGQNAVSAYALDTDDGIIVIDSLNNEDEARDILVPNMVALGLDPERIRYVIVTHGHGDHYGGAKYLQDNYGARIVASAADWQMMEDAQHGTGPFAQLVPPRKDMVAKDGDTISLGGASVRMYITPGHTPGTLSLIFPVFAHGERHMAGLMGGSGGGRVGPAIRQQISSLKRWEELTREAHVDTMITNHPSHMDATEKQVLVRYDATNGTNPFVYGEDKYQRYFQMLTECSRMQLARLGEASDAD